MNIFLKGYSSDARMVVVAKDEQVYNELKSRDVGIMRIYEDRIVFEPDKYEITICDINRDRIVQLCNYDIVEINTAGILYRAFANNEADSTIFMGAKCNSNCIMCPASDAERINGFSYSREFLLKYIDYLPTDLEYIVITGGEPTMQVLLFLEVLEKVRQKFDNTQVLMLTNGRSLSDEWLFEQVKNKHPKYFRIAIPIHGSYGELHDEITRAKGSFAQTANALGKLMNSDIDIEIRIVVTKINCDDLDNIAKLIVKSFKRVKYINFIGLEPRGNCALNFAKVYIDHRTSFLKSKNAIDYLIAHGYDVSLYNYPLCAVDKGYWSISAKSISGYKNVYHKNCDECEVKGICGGFFTAALNIAEMNVNPIVKKGK